ncbi:MAG: hypothetical protein A2V70_17175 [Planctomycetes bacterium RBG_13_63_9]|nr:MAG: hypothetical protein A2V70_17175 [Planctomycetes bacterium RBG_13_63_9]
MADSTHNQPIPDERILEAIEACRPESDDVDDPALAYLAAELAADPRLKDLFGRLQRLDATLAASFCDVPIPEGLQQRLLDRLAAARAELAVSSEAEETPAAEPPRPAARVADTPRRGSRRWMLATAGALSAAAALLVAVWIGLFDSEDYTEQAVLDEAIQFFSDESDKPPEQGRLLEVQPPPSGYPMSRAIAQVPGVRWRSIRAFRGRTGVAYDMSLGGTEATLYVVLPPVVGLAARPGNDPGHRTAGSSASTWVEGGRMYVLVVRGDVPDYERFLRRHGPLT